MKTMTFWCPDCYTFQVREVQDRCTGDFCEQCCEECHGLRVARMRAKEAELSVALTHREERPPITSYRYPSLPEVFTRGQEKTRQTRGGRRIVRKSEPMGG